MINRKPQRLKLDRQKAKDLKKCNTECDRLSLENMKLRLDIERRIVEFMDQMQDFFGIVDSLFTEDDVRTLNEARLKWNKFREVLDETEDLSKALEAIGRESIADSEQNAQLIIDLWSKNK